MHDIASLESSGLPGVFVASDEFADASAAQARSIGFDAARVFVPHPIQDRTDEEMRALADAACDEILRQLVAPADAGTADVDSADGQGGGSGH